MPRHSRRRFLQGGLVVAGLGYVSARNAAAQERARTPRIGFLAVGSREGRAFMIDGFLRGLREHGYVDGQNIAIEYRCQQLLVLGLLTAYSRQSMQRPGMMDGVPVDLSDRGRYRRPTR